MSIDYLEVIIIKIIGYLLNKTNKDKIIINAEVKIKNNTITYKLDEDDYTIIKEPQNIYLIRENKDIKSIMNFSLNRYTTCDYILKKDDIKLQIEIKTTRLEITKKIIKINYIVERQDNYEYYIEIEE